ncbi:MAG TPA: Rid family hydrolase [Allosphingosinicella sp.]
MKYALIGPAALSVAAPAAAQRSEANVVMSDHPGVRAAQEQYGYADATIAGDLIFLSGIVAGTEPGETDLHAAYERAYAVIGRVLKRAGASYDDIVDITSFHTDLIGQIDTMSQVHKKYVKGPYPTWTAIDVDRLLPDNGITEIKIIARKPAQPR